MQDNYIHTKSIAIKNLISEIYKNKNISNEMRIPLEKAQHHAKAMCILSMENDFIGVANENNSLSKVFDFLTNQFNAEHFPIENSIIKKINLKITEMNNLTEKINNPRKNNLSETDQNRINYHDKIQSLGKHIDHVVKRQVELDLLCKNARENAEAANSQSKELSSEIDNIKREANNRTEEIIKNLHEKQKEINELVGVISGTAIAGSYEKSAAEEKDLAEITRRISVILMLIIVVIIGYSILETRSPEFDWKVSLTRVILSLTISIPATYLARESTKHRSKQHEYLRMSLDLKSITPYLASLPNEEQNKIKSEMADRIFAINNNDIQKFESYPIDTQKILMAIIDKIGVHNNTKIHTNNEEK
ncbi:hypothetical protein [Sphaerotilus uruguayifluvii]|uniref:Uncharacterized protein n=1 Tax=Sphaerotilus uruguayifluvii TaxID=2735897 RepID=A0ABX2G284_9BURK|nr:hypothetical protein [Leptothrix sp. C29]NRT55387.1 hypothetical protein [Leptothrix sp. C29]